MSRGFPAEPDPGTHTTGDETAAGATLADLDLSRAHPARVYNRWLGGKDHLAADRAVAEQVARIAPWAVTGARANRAFLRRAVSSLARQGITQFLDVGAGLPSAGNVHEVAQRFQPDARVCYLDNDAVVLAHARALLADKNTIAVAGDARDPQAILTDPEVRAHLDFQLPVAVLFIAVLHFLRAEDDPAAVVAAFRDVLAPGSFVVISHMADLPDGHARPERAQATREAVKLYEELAAPFVLRTREEIAGLFTGFDLVDPGLVPAHRWRPDRKRPGPSVPVLAAVGRLRDPNPSVDSSPGTDCGPAPDSVPGPDHAPGLGPDRADPAEEEPCTGSPRGGLS